MRKIFILFLFIALCMVARAQYGGEFVLGTRINYVGGGRVIQDWGRKDLGYTLKLTVSPGYFIHRKWCVGLNLGYEFMTDDKGHQYTLEGLPYIRYYSKGEVLRFFLQLESGPGWGQSILKAGNDGRHFLWITTLKPGLYIRIKNGFATEVTVSNLENRYIDIHSAGKNLKFNRWDFQFLSISFGVSWIFGY